MAAKVEVASQQIAAVVQTMAAASEGAGLTQAEAMATSIAAVAKVVETKVLAAKAPGGSGVIEAVVLVQDDEGGLGDLDEVVTQVKANIDTLVAAKQDVDSESYDATFDANSVSSETFETVANNTKTVIAELNKTINDDVQQALSEGKDVLAESSTKALFSVTQVLAEKVKTVSETVKADDTAEAVIVFNVAAEKANLAPSAIEIAGASGVKGNLLSVEENVTLLDLGAITTTDLDIDGNPSGQTVTLSLSAESAKSFEIIDDHLFLKATPNHEAQAS